MDLQLQGKQVFISGSTSGIGFAIAKTLLAEGADVIINGRSQDSFDKAISKLNNTSPLGKVSGIATDFSDTTSIQKLLAN